MAPKLVTVTSFLTYTHTRWAFTGHLGEMYGYRKHASCKKLLFKTQNEIILAYGACGPE
jgi:hypothetical protein